MTPLTPSDVSHNTLTSKQRSLEIAALAKIERVKSVQVCAGNDRYCLVALEPEGFYEGVYEVEVRGARTHHFPDPPTPLARWPLRLRSNVLTILPSSSTQIFLPAGYPSSTVPCRFRLATKIVHPLITPLGLLSSLPPAVLSAADAVSHLLENVFDAPPTEKSAVAKAKKYDLQYGQGKTPDSLIPKTSPVRNWKPGRVAVELGCGEDDFKGYPVFYEFISSPSSSRVKGFRLQER